MPRIAIVEDALPDRLADDILEHAIASETAFRPTEVNRAASPVSPEIRTSLWCSAGLGPFKQPLKDHMSGRFAELCELTGTGVFPLARLELELVAHRDGHFYKSHIDTHTDEQGQLGKSSRMLSAVLYLNRRPRAFHGGNIRFAALLGDGEQVIEVGHNRLVAFPSFTPHEVLETHVPGGLFADSRFAVNCWFHREWEQREGE